MIAFCVSLQLIACHESPTLTPSNSQVEDLNLVHPWLYVSPIPNCRPSLVFPPLDIAERGIDLDMENLFRTAGAGSDPADDDDAAGGALGAAAMALPQARLLGCGVGLGLGEGCRSGSWSRPGLESSLRPRTCSAYAIAGMARCDG